MIIFFINLFTDDTILGFIVFVFMFNLSGFFCNYLLTSSYRYIIH